MEIFQQFTFEASHTHRNQISGLESPTAERIAPWLWRRLAPSRHGLPGVEVRETETAGCGGRGEDEPR